MHVSTVVEDHSTVGTSALLGKGSHAFVTPSRSGAVTPTARVVSDVCAHSFFSCNLPEAHVTRTAFNPCRKIAAFAVVPSDDTQAAPNFFCNQIWFNQGGSYETTALLDHLECGTADL
jgi:hypothetical protein